MLSRRISCAECYLFYSVTLKRTLHYFTVPVTPFQQNCSIIWCDEAKLAAIVDPGGDIDKLLAAVKKTGSKLEQIWLTRAHRSRRRNRRARCDAANSHHRATSGR